MSLKSLHSCICRALNTRTCLTCPSTTWLTVELPLRPTDWFCIRPWDSDPPRKCDTDTWAAAGTAETVGTEPSKTGVEKNGMPAKGLLFLNKLSQIHAIPLQRKTIIAHIRALALCFISLVVGAIVKWTAIVEEQFSADKSEYWTTFCWWHLKINTKCLGHSFCNQCLETIKEVSVQLPQQLLFSMQHSWKHFTQWAQITLH